MKHCLFDMFEHRLFSWDEVIERDRKKLDMDSANPQNCSEWRRRLRERLVKVEENGL